MPPYLLNRRYAYGRLDERLRVQFLRRLVEQSGDPHLAVRVVEAPGNVRPLPQQFPQSFPSTGLPVPNPKRSVLQAKPRTV